MLKIKKNLPNIKAKNFCYDFEHSNRPKYIFGRNELAKSIAVNIEIDGFIDDFTSETIYCNKPIVSIENVPNNALVVVVVVGKPLIAEKRVSQFQFEYIDYFSFYKYSDLSISNIMFWDGMIDDIKSNLSKYKQIYELLYDKESKNQMYNILNFRVAYDINYMRGFSAKEDVQYFEEFLNLQENNEVFVDVGGFDGYTSEEFIKKCPNYSSVHIFEPEESNFLLAQDRLSKYQNINYYKKGLSNKKESLKFDVCGSSSKINVDGQLIIAVDRLDDLLDQKITFIKMDIEGAEGMAIEGAKQTIKKYHPKLAISVYHKIDDFWKIPEQILKIREDYTIYLRHYTEGISETVMFFIPKI